MVESAKSPRRLSSAGAEVLVAGSTVFNQKASVAENLAPLRRSFAS